MEVLLTKDYVYSLLEDKRISKADFAKSIGLSSRTNLDALLDAKKKDINSVIRMAEALGMSLQEFIGFEPSPFKIRGFVKVGEQVREIATEKDWFEAEAKSGLCTVPYYEGFNAACDAIDDFVKSAIKKDDSCSMMGRVNGEAVFNISVIDEFGTDENNVTMKIGRQIIVSVLSSKKGMTTSRYSTFENTGDLGFMFLSIKAEIQNVFYNRNE
ncbi:MAG: helix-turn-helix transcriptional regulator [Bacteroidales bacterium]|nr:helix-turn-helix transcriptional regulator [Bacteroidales bacterium]